MHAGSVEFGCVRATEDVAAPAETLASLAQTSSVDYLGLCDGRRRMRGESALMNPDSKDQGTFGRHCGGAALEDASLSLFAHASQVVPTAAHAAVCLARARGRPIAGAEVACLSHYSFA